MNYSYDGPGAFAPVKSALRALRILDILTGYPRGLTFVELCSLTGWPRSSLYNLLQTMKGAGYVQLVDESRRFRVGIRAWEAGEAYRRHNDLASLARPFLMAAKEELNETVQLAVLDGMENVYIAKVETDYHLKLDSEVGRRLPAHATGLGKVLLASLTIEELQMRLSGAELRRFTPDTLTDPDALMAELEWVRLRGYSIDKGEYTAGVYCVAVPVHDGRGEVVAAMSSSVPFVRASPAMKDKMLRVLQKQAQHLSLITAHGHVAAAQE